MHPNGERREQKADELARMTEAIVGRFSDMADPQVAGDAAEAVLNSGVLEAAEIRGALLATHLLTGILDEQPDTGGAAGVVNAFHDALESGGWASVGRLWNLGFED